MKRHDPISVDDPLGISKREWRNVLLANLCLLLFVYAVACVFALCGSSAFILGFESADLARIEATLRSWQIFPLVQALFATVEFEIASCFVARSRPKWWRFLSFYAVLVVANVSFTAAIGYYPPIVSNVAFITLMGVSVFMDGFRENREWLRRLARFGIALAASFVLNGAIAFFRMGCAEFLSVDIPLSADLALSVEYDLAFALSLGTIALTDFKGKGGEERCPTCQVASGSSPIAKNSSPKNSKTATISPEVAKRIRRVKIKVAAIQTSALVAVASLVWFVGKPIEFSLVFASFCFTRMVLGFRHSLHLKSELACVSLGSLAFVGLAFLSPSAEVSIVMSACYGAFMAIGFRLYWELRDLIMLKKASKMDRYAMLYVVFKGNMEAPRVNGMMRAKGYSDKSDIEIVQRYVAREKVEYIAKKTGFAPITIEKRLTEIANDLYSRR